jgi:hypothetical protein
MNLCLLIYLKALILPTVCCLLAEKPDEYHRISQNPQNLTPGAS